jgi:1-phosphofructokinase family hexose kinase
MILIITLNPLLERRFTYQQIKIGDVNRNATVKIAAGGKGLNVSRQLKKFGIKSFNFFFSGGNDGKIFRDIVKQQNLEFTSVITKTETRNAAIVFSENDNVISSYFSNDPIISKTEVDEFKSKLDKMIQNCEVVVFSGSSPCKETDSIIPFGIELANKYDKISICDTYGNSLKACIDATPTMIHNNYYEIENGFGIKLTDEDSILSYLNMIYKKNIKRVFLSNGSNNFYASNFDYIYKIKPVKIHAVDATGSGDCFVAGVIKGWINSEVFEDTLKFSTAVAGLNAATIDVSSVEPDEVNLIKDNVEIIPVGKKTKTIDDTPHEI